MDRAENLVQSQAVFHGQNKLSQQIAAMFADHGHPENLIFAGNGEHFDKTLDGTVGYGPSSSAKSKRVTS